MPAKGRGKWQTQGKAKTRARFHDYNSTRRFRGQGTVSWRKYQEQQRKKR